MERLNPGLYTAVQEQGKRLRFRERLHYWTFIPSPSINLEETVDLKRDYQAIYRPYRVAYRNRKMGMRVSSPISKGEIFIEH